MRDGDEVRRTAPEFTGGSRFVYPVWHGARTQAPVAPTWLYRFTRTPPLPPGLPLAPPRDGLAGYGVHHTAELPYTLDTLTARAWPWTDADRELARTMADTWARFVTDHDPGGGPLPGWPEFTGEKAMVFGGDTPELGPVRRLDAMRLLDRVPRPLLD
ncbi:carboxylesterase family protein [Streptomyces sasae]|uniref:carboxylesterase family protein n=1 Tax=Streptomyces sasae TaxID=1266772 RepID=UPI00292D2281|nr:carboxylesterase family protein [Streptomyces sasae]